MKEIKFDIKNFSYTEDENPDISFVPMMLRRKLDSFGRAAFYTLYNAYNKNPDINLVFSSNYGDFERVKKLTGQRKLEGTISPAGFSMSVHNAVIGLFSLIEQIKTGYNSISAGEKTLACGILEGVLQSSDKECLVCYTEDFGVTKSVSVLISQKPDGHYIIKNNEGEKPADGFKNFTEFLDGEHNEFISNLFVIKRIES